LAAHRIRAIGNPRERFAEDKLRLLRAVRFSASLGFALEEYTLAAIREMAGEITAVSAERIAMEMRRMLVEAGRVRAVELLLDANLAPFVLPEIVPSSAEDRQKLEESLDVLGRLAGGMPTLAVGMNEDRETASHAHDKRGHATTESGPSFSLALMTLLHKVVSPEVSVEIGRRWKLSNDEADRIFWLLQHQTSLAEAKTLRWSQLQPILISEGIGDLLSFMEAVTPAMAEAAAYCRDQLKRPREELDPPPLVTGEDLIALGIPQGPQYRVLLDKIRNLQLDGKLENHEDALRFAERNQQ
jgi:poly(A) polymerase